MLTFIHMLFVGTLSLLPHQAAPAAPVAPPTAVVTTAPVAPVQPVTVTPQAPPATTQVPPQAPPAAVPAPTVITDIMCVVTLTSPAGQVMTFSPGKADSNGSCANYQSGWPTGDTVTVTPEPVTSYTNAT